MSDRRVFRWATTSARLLAGTLVAVGFVVGVVTAVSVPWPTLGREPVAVTATPAPSASVLVCTGGLLALGRELEDVGRVVTAAPQTVTSGAAAEAPAPRHRAARVARGRRHGAADRRDRGTARGLADRRRGIRFVDGLGR